MTNKVKLEIRCIWDYASAGGDSDERNSLSDHVTSSSRSHLLANTRGHATTSSSSNRYNHSKQSQMSVQTTSDKYSYNQAHRDRDTGISFITPSAPPPPPPGGPPPLPPLPGALGAQPIRSFSNPLCKAARLMEGPGGHVRKMRSVQVSSPAPPCSTWL